MSASRRAIYPMTQLPGLTRRLPSCCRDREMRPRCIAPRKRSPSNCLGQRTRWRGLRATDPTDAKTKEKTQHGANRLAAIGLSVLTVVPRSSRAGGARLDVLGGSRQRNGYCFTWPIWSHSISLAAIRALLSHPRLDGPAARDAFGVVERRRARRISAGKFMNVTRAEPIETQGGPEREAHNPECAVTIEVDQYAAQDVQDSIDVPPYSHSQNAHPS